MRESLRAEYIAKLPPVLRALLDAELAAGTELLDVELGRGEEEGKIFVILKHPFRANRAAVLAELAYRENLDRDPELRGFYTADEQFAVLTVKFKPMVFEKITGPPNPTEAHIARMKEREKAEQKAANGRWHAEHNPPPATPIYEIADPTARFLASMKITFDMWHDGLGYDLDALKKIPPAELKSIESTLIQHSPRDWRDIEALAHIDSQEARKVVEAALKSSDPHVRNTAMDYAGEKADPADREKLLIKSLQQDSLFGGLSQAIDEVPEFHPPAVVEALFRGALNRDGEAAVHFAALLFYLHGKAAEPFDWAHRPFFLRFNTANREERKAVFRELCETVGVDPAKYVR